MHYTHSYITRIFSSYHLQFVRMILLLLLHICVVFLRSYLTIAHVSNYLTIHAICIVIYDEPCPTLLIHVLFVEAIACSRERVYFVPVLSAKFMFDFISQWNMWSSWQVESAWMKSSLGRVCPIHNLGDRNKWSQQ